MFKKLLKLSAIFDKIDFVIDEIKGLVSDFEKAYEDGKIDSAEATTLLLGLIKALRKVFPKL